MVWHLWKLNLLSTDIVKKSFSTQHQHHIAKRIEGTNYDIIRYRNLSLEDIIKELENE